MQTTDTREPPAQVGRQREARQYSVVAEISHGNAQHLFRAEVELVRFTAEFQERYYLNGVPTARNSEVATRAAQRVTWGCILKRLIWNDLDVLQIADGAFARKLSQCVTANAVAVWSGLPDSLKPWADTKLGGVRLVERQV